MKSLFNDYKTPSMSECDVLGKEIGLHKRVVQVWFQNARAKERKSRGDDDPNRTLPSRCDLCTVEFGTRGNISMQDHIFTTGHIAHIKECGASLRGISITQPEDGTAQMSQSSVVLQSTIKLAKSGGKDSNTRRSSSSATTTKATIPGNQMAAAAQFPYNFMYGMSQSQFFNIINFIYV